jgi:XTP/dITP diphosphohydrolase
MRLVLATKNQGKLKEIKVLVQISKSNLSWIKLELAPEQFGPEETGSTFAENALIKAQEAAKLTGAYALADDSGLAVDALGKRPGIYSARYAEGDEVKGCKKLIAELKNIPPNQRSATYHCVMVLVSPHGELLCQADGIWHGTIIDQMRGQGGFGYDPIFYLEDLAQTAAEISLQEKNNLSHRAQSWQKIEEYLTTYQSQIEGGE